MYTRLTFNLANVPIRHETLHGKKYLVAPMVMITEGVHNGSGGALLYKAAEIKKATAAWNMKPIVVYHPSIDGKGISACDPLVLEKQQVGMVMNTRWKDKLCAEAWIEEARAEVVDNRVLEALEKNKKMEVSTGLFTENTGGPGEFGGKEYVNEATNHQPDHLALLPDQIGACSIADGAGLLQLNQAAVDSDLNFTHQFEALRRLIGNAMSNSNVTSALNRELKARFKALDCYVLDTYPDFFIYECYGPNGGDRKLWKLGYTAKKTDVTIDSENPVEVVRVTEYRTADEAAKFVGNDARQTKEKSMEKAKVIDAIIANQDNDWQESDRATLEKMEDVTLNKFMPKGKKKKMMESDEEEEMMSTENAAPAPVKPLTMVEYINAAPEGIRDVLTNSVAVHEAEKIKLVDSIVANKANKFTKEFLAGKSLNELQGIAALAGSPVTNTQPQMFYGGQATPAGQPTNNAAPVVQEALVMPTMNFAKK